MNETKAMESLKNAIDSDDDELFLKVAMALHDLYRSDEIAPESKPKICIYSAFCFEIANEPKLAKIPYSDFKSNGILPVDPSIYDKNLLDATRYFLYSFGQRDSPEIIKTGKYLFDLIIQLDIKYTTTHSDVNVYELMMLQGLIGVMKDYIELLTNNNPKDLKLFIDYLKSINNIANEFDSSSWISTFTKLVVIMLNRLIKRNINTETSE